MARGRHISIHALLAESDLSKRQVEQRGLFLSTLSLRRATLNLPSKPIDKNISIHALLAESDILILSDSSEQAISIHALLAESDEQTQGFKIPAHGISIHALLAESDRL